MLNGKELTILDALGVSLASILVVFAVLFILFVAVSLFPVILKEKPAVPVPAAKAPDASNDGSLIAVMAAAVRAYESERIDTPVPLARNVRR